jgi:hypothetical protein
MTTLLVLPERGGPQHHHRVLGVGGDPAAAGREAQEGTGAQASHVLAHGRPRIWRLGKAIDEASQGRELVPAQRGAQVPRFQRASKKEHPDDYQPAARDGAVHRARRVQRAFALQAPAENL